MGIYFASGRSQLPSNSWNISVGTGGNLVANTYYFSLQARNRVGLTLPLYSSLITVATNNTITFTINQAAKESGEEWISYVISANTINQPISYCQIAEIPLVNLNNNISNSFPLTLTLNNQEQLKLNAIIANNTLFPTAIHGMCRGLISTGLIYKYNIYDNTPQDNLYTFNGVGGKWRATGKFTTYITSVLDVDGCFQDVRSITDPSTILVPKYNPTGTSSTPITLWLTSSSIVNKGTRISITVRLGELNKSQLFDGLIELKFKGFVNLITGIKRTTLADNTPLDDVDVLYKYDANNPTLILPDDLDINEAYILEINCNFQSTEIEDYIVNGSFISIYPEFTASASIYNPAGVILGDLIFKDADRRRIVPNLGLTATALKGAGLIKNFSFPVQNESIVTALVPNTTNIIAINKLGNVYTATSLPSDSVQRALVKTIAGESNPSAWSSNIVATANTSLSITVIYPCTTEGVGTIRADYPDVIAANNKGIFNPLFINLYIDNGTFIRKFTNAVIPGVNQTFTVSSFITGTITSLPSNLDNDFSLFNPVSVSGITTAGGNLFGGTYRVAYSFVYDGNQITSISHKEVDGCVAEITFNLIEALQNFTGTWLNGTGVPSDLIGHDKNYYIDNISKNYYNKIADVWILLGNLSGNGWMNGIVDPISSDGYSGDYFLNTVNYNIFLKTTDTIWTPIGTIKGDKWFSGIIDPVSADGNIGDYFLNTASFFVFRKTSLTVWTNIGAIKGDRWFHGIINPVSADAGVGDYFLNTVSNDIFRKTTDTVWTPIGSIRGTRWITAHGLPTSGGNFPETSVAIVGDHYLNRANSFFYIKTALPNVWAYVGTLRGTTWLNAFGTPAAGLGSIDDYYIDRTTNDYYNKTGATVWALVGNLRGATGSVTAGAGVVIDNAVVAPVKNATQISIYSNSGIPTLLTNTNIESIFAFTNRVQSHTASLGTAMITLTDAPTIVTNLSLGNVFKVTLAGNRFFGSPSNTVSGFKYIFNIIQDGTGSRTATFNNTFRFRTTPVLSIAANARDIVTCVCDGNTLFCTFEAGW